MSYRREVLTVHLTALDLSRTVVRSVPSVTQELLAGGKNALGVSVPPPHLAGWVPRTRAALRPVMRPYLDLLRAPRWSPDFITPTDAGNDFHAALEQVLTTPAATLRAELEPALAGGQLPSRVADLAAGRPEAVRRLGAAMTAFHDVAVAPYWSEITAAVHADRAARGSTIVDQGIERVLTTLSPYLRWQASALSYECAAGADVDIDAGGRGVTLIPSYLEDQPCFMAVAGAPVVICYPIQRPERELTLREPLADLLGRTRAAVLAAADGGRSTTQIAQAVGTSVGSASQHATVLRAAGLITTHRTGAAVRHTLTPLGQTLLTATNSTPIAG